MVLAQRQKVLLIDLSKFLYMFSKGILLLQYAVRLRQPVWFISLDPMKASIVRKASQWCGEYHVSTY
jgi:ribosomal protein S2